MHISIAPRQLLHLSHQRFWINGLLHELLLKRIKVSKVLAVIGAVFLWLLPIKSFLKEEYVVTM